MSHDYDSPDYEARDCNGQVLRAGDRVAPAPDRVDRYPRGARGRVRRTTWTDDDVEMRRVDVEWDHANKGQPHKPAVENMPPEAVRKLGLIERIGEIETDA